MLDGVSVGIEESGIPVAYNFVAFGGANFIKFQNVFRDGIDYIQ